MRDQLRQRTSPRAPSPGRAARPAWRPRRARASTRTLSRPSRADSARSQSTRRSIGSMSTNSTSGRAIASTSPGSPAPLPMSPDDARAEQRREQHAVQDVPRPEAGELRAGRSARALRRVARDSRVYARASVDRDHRTGHAATGGSGSIDRRSRARVGNVSRETTRRVITVWRSRPSPSDSETKPRSATMSCTILRSYDDIGGRDADSAPSSMRAIARSTSVRQFRLRAHRAIRRCRGSAGRSARLGLHRNAGRAPAAR